MSSATLNQVLTLTYRLAQKEGKTLAKFGPHDLRRTASTLLHEAGYNTDWIEKCLAHEQKGVRAVYNIAAGERDAAREFATLLHVENRPLSQWNHGEQLFTVDESLSFHS
jgi:integrase